MINFETNGEKGYALLHIPTSLNDFPVDYLKDITSNIKLAKDYSLIALCHRERLSNIILAARQKKNELNTGVIPIFIKCDSSSNEEFFNQINIKDKLVISGSDLAMGNHINIKENIMTPDTIIDYVEGDGYAYQNALKIKDYCYFLQFKLVPNCAIRGYFTNGKVENYAVKFITTIPDTTSEAHI